LNWDASDHVSLKSSQQGEVHGLGSTITGTAVEKFLNIE